MVKEDKTIIGLIESVEIVGRKETRSIMARIDTGATKSSVDKSLSQELDLGPVVGEKVVKSAHGTSKRPLVEASLKLRGKKVKGDFSIADRSHMRYQLLIGQNILKQGFLIDPNREADEK